MTPDVIARMSPKELDQLHSHLLAEVREQKRADAEESLAEFTRQAWPVIRPGTPLIWEKHMDAICIHLQAVTEKQIRNLIITLPPGCTKSILCGVMWPAWTWVRSPHVQWLTGSNEESLAIRDAVTCRNLIRSEWYQANWGNVFQFTGDQQNLKWFYENTAKGFRWTITTKSNVTGKKGNILLLDDPNDAATVESEAERAALHQWLDETWYDRVNDYKDDCRVVIGQRTGENDGIGHLKKNGGWTELCLPEEFEPSKKYFIPQTKWTDWRTKPGELLRPERYGLEQVAQAKARLRSKYFAQHQQDPVGTEGERFKREWFRYYHKDQDGYWSFPEANKRIHPDAITDRFLTVDQATTVKQVAKDDPDCTCVSSWGMTKCGLLVWLGCWNDRVEAPDIPPVVAGQYLRFKAKQAHVESGGTQKSNVQYLRRYEIEPGKFMNIIEFFPGSSDKLERSLDAMAAMQAGRIWMPANDPTFPLGEVESQLLRFTGDARQSGHDDIVDSLSMAGKRLTAGDSKSKVQAPRVMMGPRI